MALSNGRSGSNSSLIFLDPRSKNADGEKLDTPYLEVTKIVNGKFEKQPDEKPTEVSGTLTRIEFKEREFKGQKQKSTVLYFYDGKANEEKGETYALNCNYRISTRSIFNAIVSLTRFDNLKLSYYLNRKGYESFSLRQGDELVPWKFKLEDLPDAEEIRDRHGNLVKTDFSPIDDFYEAELKAVAAKLNGGKTEAKAAAPAAAPAKPADPAPAAAATTTPAADPKASAKAKKATTPKATEKPADPAPAPVAAPTGNDSDVPF